MAIQAADIPLDPPVLLAPMAGITGLPFRRLVAGFGAGLVVSEMVASQEMVQARRGSRPGSRSVRTARRRPVPAAPEGAAFAEMAARHYEVALSFYGRDLGARVMRKHLGWYMDAAATPAERRRAVLTERDPARVLRLLPGALAGRAGREAA